MSNIPITNPPANLTMVDVLAMTSAYGGLAKSCRYIVRVVPQGTYLVQSGYSEFMKQLTYMCEVAELPGRSFMNMDARYYGPNFKMPFQSTYEDTTFTFLCRQSSFERQFFDDWMEIINPTNIWDFNYRDTYAAEIQVYQLADYGEGTNPTAPVAMYMWTLHQAYPIVINPQPVTWADDNFQRLSVSFTYTNWTRKGWDRDAQNFAGPSGDGFIRGSQSLNLPINKKL